MPHIDTQWTSWRRSSWTGLGMLLAGLLILGLQSGVAWRARDTQVRETTAGLRNLAASLLRQVESTIEIADTAVLNLVERLETVGTSPPALAQIDRKLLAQLAEKPRYRSIVVTGPDGEWLSTSLPVKGSILFDRDYFQQHRAQDGLGTIVSRPFQSLLYGDWIINVSRRYNAADGSFAGIVQASIDLATFTEYFASFDLGSGSSIGLTSTNGIGLARSPTNPNFIGRDISAAAVFSELRQRPTGTFENRGLVDGVHRLNGYDSSRRYQLVAVASMSQEHALAAWRSDTRLHLSIAFFLTSAAALLGILLRHQLTRQLGAERRELLAAQTTNASLDTLTRHLGKARDDANQASRAKSRFLAAMSHELRTPLNGILGYAQLLRIEGGLDERQAARVDAMLGAGTHLLELIHSVLELSEIEAGQVERRSAPAVLRGLAGACLDLLRPAADDKGLTLTLFIEPGLPIQIMTDPTRLRQVLVNLLGNAVKFTTRGGVELRILKTRFGAKLRFEVADTGPGIPECEVDRLFKEFERLEPDVTRQVEGAGLGLALSARLASLIGAGIGYADNRGGGSVFWLELPLVPLPSDQLAPAANGNSDRVAAVGFHALHVLVVDDVLMNRDIASAFLQAAGHRVQCAEGGAAAVAAVAATDFDVVLMDVRMPEMDGLEATRRIRALGGARGGVAIVALTAQAFTEQVRECREAGMDTHLSKPFSQDALIEIVASAAKAGRARVRSCGPVPGSEFRVLNPATFAATISYLSPGVVPSYLRNIVGLGETLLRDLDGQAGAECFGAKLADDAHKLAGSAGLFGFERLAELGREFERAVQSDAPGVQELAEGLRAAIEATIQDIAANRLQTVEG